MWYFPHDEYPKDAQNYDKNKLIKAKVITFDTMLNACQTIHEKIYMFNWSVTNAKKYGQAECIKTSVVDDICNHTKSV